MVFHAILFQQSLQDDVQLERGNSPANARPWTETERQIHERIGGLVRRTRERVVALEPALRHVGVAVLEVLLLAHHDHAAGYNVGLAMMGKWRENVVE